MAVDSQQCRLGWYVGLMSGTVLDGNIDVALLQTDGRRVEEHGHYALQAYDQTTQELLFEALAQAQCWQFSKDRPGVFAKVERRLTLAQSAAVSQLVNDAGLALQDVLAVGFHGQTVLHRAPRAGQLGASCQLGDGGLMAATLGCTVVSDFRRRDISAGGQGAPLSAVYHQALLQRAGIAADTAILNLGGVANLTWTDHRNTLVAFDTGPANAPLNDFVRQRGLGDMDFDGCLAASGQVDEDRLNRLLQHPYLQQAWPKSLDRNDFGVDMAAGLSDADGAALLTAFSAATVGLALDLLPARPQRLIVCGGGRHNPTMIRHIEERARVRCTNADVLGWRGDAIEAECFAYLAARTLRNLPSSYPGTTGTALPCVAGVISRPDV